MHDDRPNPSERGLFVAIEGPDGAGKTTQASLLARALRAGGERVVEVREPGGTALGERIRAALLDSALLDGAAAGAGLDERAALFLFLASRAQLATEVIRPALAEGALVIADRFYASTAVYQGLALGEEGAAGGAAGEPAEGTADAWMRRILELSHLATRGLRPDLTILLDLEPDAARARLAERGGLDRLDRRGLAAVDRLILGYRRYARLARERGERVEVVPAARAAAEVARDVRARLEGVLAERGPAAAPAGVRAEAAP